MANLQNGTRSLTRGSVFKTIVTFALPLLIGQLLQQLYNLADAWVIGNFAEDANNAFAAVSSSGNITWLIIGFFNGVGIGGGVIISRFFGANDQKNTDRAIHTCFLFGLISSLLSTAVGLMLVPNLLVWMGTPVEVLPAATTYFTIYFGGVSTIIMYNICMAIMRAVGDSVHPLEYLIISTMTNVLLDMIFVAVLQWGVAGAAIATVIAQGLSTVLCVIRMRRPDSGIALSFKKLQLHPEIMRAVLAQGLPTGIQNAVISIGNIVIQSNINKFGADAMSGHGAYGKIEGFVFLPITCISMTMPTFISQNLGARLYDRARKGAVIGIAIGVVLAELIGLTGRFFAPTLLQIFIHEEAAITYGCTDFSIIVPFYFLLAFSHCSAGVLRGCGKSIIPMIAMLMFWCGLRIVYVTTAIHFVNEYRMICWAYPLTWCCSSVLFLIYLLRTDWTHAFDVMHKSVA